MPAAGTWEEIGMANLIKCPDCGRDVSLAATSCPGCGRPIAQAAPAAMTPVAAPPSARDSREVSTAPLKVVGVIVGSIVGFWVIFKVGRDIAGIGVLGMLIVPALIVAAAMGKWGKSPPPACKSIAGAFRRRPVLLGWTCALVFFGGWAGTNMRSTLAEMAERTRRDVERMAAEAKRRDEEEAARRAKEAAVAAEALRKIQGEVAALTVELEQIEKLDLDAAKPRLAALGMRLEPAAGAPDPKPAEVGALLHRFGEQRTRIAGLERKREADALLGKFSTARADIEGQLKKLARVNVKKSLEQAQQSLGALRGQVEPYKVLTDRPEVKAILDGVEAQASRIGAEEQRRKEIEDKKAAAEQARAQVAAALAAAGMQVTALQLWRDYQANEVSADAQYKGKKLLVTGAVASIDKGPLGGIHVRLRTPNMFMHVSAEMEDAEAAAAGQLGKGQPVRLQCQGAGMVIGSPMLSDCKFFRR